MYKNCWSSRRPGRNRDRDRHRHRTRTETETDTETETGTRTKTETETETEPATATETGTDTETKAETASELAASFRQCLAFELPSTCGHFGSDILPFYLVNIFLFCNIVSSFFIFLQFFKFFKKKGKISDISRTGLISLV